MSQPDLARRGALAPPEPRRAFLSRLASLPFATGSVAVLGDPVASAEPNTQVAADPDVLAATGHGRPHPVSDQLLAKYDAWLEIERQRLRSERFGRGDGAASPFASRFELVWRDRETGDVFDHSRASWLGSGHRRGSAEPSTRAAIVLAAAGVCPTST